MKFASGGNPQKDFKTASRVRDDDVDFAIETTETLSAGSIELGRLVAAITTTLERALRPSMSVSSCDTTRRSTSPLVCVNQSDNQRTTTRAITYLFTLGGNGVDLINEDNSW